LPLALDAWLAAQDAAINVLIAGGGSLVDAIRRASRTFSLHDETAHWLATDAMSIHCRLLGSSLANANLISTYSALLAAVETGAGTRIVFDPNQFLRDQESHLPGCVLPCDWTVSSDSIAARIAEVLAADELVLLKSAEAGHATASALVESGFVDRFFPSFDRCHFDRRYVNLRGWSSVFRRGASPPCIG
jgi:aspartokinase-like uncharacterized kinase